jgi:hypothetical protein
MAEQILAIGSIDYAIEEVDSLKKLTRNVSSIHCVDDALFHLRKAREALDEGLKNPDVWAKENTDAIRTFMFMLPYLLLYKDMGIV